MNDEQLFNQAVDYQQQGRNGEALDILLGLSKRHTENGYVHGTLGLVYSSLGRIPDSIESFKRGVVFDPLTKMWQVNLARMLIQNGNLQEALQYAEGESLSDRLTHAKVLEAQAKYREAVEVLDKALATLPRGNYEGRTIPVEADLSYLKMLYSQCCRRLGEPQRALNMLSRPNVIPSTPRSLLSPSLTPSFAVLFEKGMCFDLLGDYPAAWDCFLAANRAMALPYEREVFSGFLERAIKAPRTHKREHGGSRLIFIVGIPRSGTSLLEQALSRHSQITAMGERPNMLQVSRRLDREGWPDLSPSQLEDLAREYLEECPTEGYVTDKLPDNWWHVDLIRQIFPEATILHCIRDPQDCLTSCFMQMFGHAGMGWAASLEGLQAYYDLWKDFDVGGFDVHYEDLVSDPPKIIRGVLKEVSLPFEDSCTRPHESDRYVSTASYAQVREPIHTKSIGRGANYEKWLPIKKTP